MVAGVAGGLAQKFGIEPTIVRIVLVIMTLGSGVGLALYVLAWLLVPFDGEDHNIASRAYTDGRGIALALTFVPVLALLLAVTSAVGVPLVSSMTWALCLSGAGLVLVYRNAEEDEQAFLRRVTEPLMEFSSKGTHARRLFVLRLCLGVLLAGVGLVFLLSGHSTLSALRPLGGVLLVLGAIVLVFGPWWLRLARDLVAERQARIRAEERADMAARVHDSVLQTLALIQRSSHEPQAVTQLARTQERELRSWLLDGSPPAPIGSDDVGTVSAAVAQIARELETVHGLAADDVTVGDCPLDDDLRALVAAAREAATNAGKWSGAEVVSIFAEVEPEEVSLFVRDRGRGFDPEGVAPDRRGIAGSIKERMARHGGRAIVRSAPGEGTEVALSMPRR